MNQYIKEKFAWFKLHSLVKPEARVYQYLDVKDAREAGINEGIMMAQKLLAEKVEEILAFDKAIFVRVDTDVPNYHLYVKKELLNKHLNVLYKALDKMKYEFNNRIN